MSSQLQLFNLSPELTEPILEQALNDDPLTFSRLRLVSRSYNTLVTPLRYREWTLKTHDMDAPGAFAVTQDVIMHATKIFAHEPVHWQIVGDSFQNFPRLQSLIWHISSKCGARWEKVSIALPIPRSVLRPDVQLFIEDFHIGYSIKIPRCQLESPHHIPSSKLVSFKIGHIPTGVLMREFARALVKCENLRILSCGSDQYNMCFPLKFGPGEVMPPLTELYLKNYLWGQSSPYNAPHWNFQQLQTLEIIKSSTELFITPANFASMGSLRVLKIDGWLTPQLLSIILSQIPQLEQLEIKCGLATYTRSAFVIPPACFRDVWRHWPFDTIGESLQKLHSLRKLKIVKKTGEMPLVFAGPSWEILVETCPQLESLELDIHIWDQKDMGKVPACYVEPLLVLEAIARFPKLQHLQAHIIRPRGPRRSSSYYEGDKMEDVDTHSCKAMAQHFLRHNSEYSSSIFECLEIQTALRRYYWERKKSSEGEFLFQWEDEV